ncbi:MAG: ParB N-terminal domain-containing protein, partial [Pseudoruegeria sp.]
MAKRKRLTPAQTAFLAPEMTSQDSPVPPTRGAPPIAQVSSEASLSAALEDLAGTLSTARQEGRFIEEIPLTQIATDHLMRDRIAANDDEMDALVESIRARGQQMPIEVSPLGHEAFGLISGWRRIAALSRLHQQTGETRFATVKALVRDPETSADAYVAMVEENEIRVGLSFYERARIV